MSEFHINVVKIDKVEKHPNADTLSTTKIHGGYPCIFKSGSFKEGDLAVYVPVDSVLPNRPEFSFLSTSERKRLKAKKLRGYFSMGILVPAPEGYKEGDDVSSFFAITKWNPPISKTFGECEKGPDGWRIPTYTDIEGLRRHPDILQPNEEVVLVEKIHGCNARFVHDGDRLWVGSRTQIKKFSETNLWWRAVAKISLEKKISAFPMMVFCGEVFGQVQDLKYNHDNKDEPSFVVFDIFSIKDGKYLDFDDMIKIANKAGLNTAPVLYRGPWTDNLHDYAEGTSLLGNNVREGFVVRPIKERFSDKIGRVILKLHGQGYLLRKN